jgi:hypothetical protein
MIMSTIKGVVIPRLAQRAEGSLNYNPSYRETLGVH